MPKIQVWYYGAIGKVVPKQSETLEIKTMTIRGMLEELIRRYGLRFEEMVLDKETKEVSSHYQILVNGKNIHFLEGEKTTLKEGDSVIFFPPVAGG